MLLQSKERNKTEATSWIYERQKMNEKQIYKKAIKKWGEQSQIMVAIEEMSELIKVLCKYPRKVNGVSRDEVIAEIVDVEIMIEQLKVLFDVSDFEFYPEKMKKLARLDDMLKKNE